MNNFTKIIHNINMEIKQDWKEESKLYLIELQKFLDKVDNVENEYLKKDIIIQMLKCDKELTKLAETKFKEYYKQGQEWQDE